MRFAILGSGTMPVKCMELLLREPGAELVLVLADPARETRPTLLDAAKAKGIPALTCPNVKEASVLSALKEARADYLLSINNYQVLSPEILGLTTYGAINLHNSALPRYAGSNACSWAILNGEASHGVTWHKIDSGIDSGDILAQATFPLNADSNALSVILQAMCEGISLFEKFLPALIAGTTVFSPQQGERSYYVAKDRPFDGKFPLNAPYVVLERLSRAIQFHPLPNMFFRPRLQLGSATIDIDAFTIEPLCTNRAAGTILSVTDDTVTIATQDAAAHITQLTDAEGHALDFRRLGLSTDIAKRA